MNDSTLPLIAIAGAPNAGKDTMANYLVETYSYTRVSFADPIRSIIYNTFNLNMSLMRDRAYESTPLIELGGLTIKATLQKVGKTFTDISDSVWVDIPFRELNLTNRIVFADVRRTIELEKISRAGGVLVYVHSNRPTPQDGRDMSHESETYREFLKRKADYHLTNNTSTTLEDYHKAIHDLIERLKEGYTNVGTYRWW
jgi:hypothetical protein